MAYVVRILFRFGLYYAALWASSHLLLLLGADYAFMHEVAKAFFRMETAIVVAVFTITESILAGLWSMIVSFIKRKNRKEINNIGDSPGGEKVDTQS